MNIALPVQSTSAIELVASAPSITAPPTPQNATAPTETKQEKSTSGEQKRAYPAPASAPTQTAPKGVRFDFNDGARIVCPQGEHPWQVKIRDLDTGNI